MDENPSDLHLAWPQGEALVVFWLSALFVALSTVTSSLRFWVRYREGNFGADDWTMVFGQLAYLASCAVTGYGCFIGFGTRDAQLNELQRSEGMKYLLIWELLYFTASTLIKTAISLTLVRVAAGRRAYEIALYVIIAVLAGNGLVGVLGGLLICRPIEANWDLHATEEQCNFGWTLIIGFTVTGLSILTDFACATVPVFLLWNVQMKRRRKILTWFILALGATASISTLIRIPWLKYWDIREDQLFNLSNVLIWSNVECGIGIVAGSLPMLGRLVRRWLHPEPTPPENLAKRHNEPGNSTIVTIGGSGGGVGGGGKSTSSKSRKTKGLSVASLSTIVENHGSYHALDEELGVLPPGRSRTTTRSESRDDNYIITVQRDVQVHFEMMSYHSTEENDTEKAKEIEDLYFSRQWPLR